jgi:hypothetical protein
MRRSRKYWVVRGRSAYALDSPTKGRRCISCGFGLKDKVPGPQCYWCDRRDNWDTERGPKASETIVWSVPPELKELLLHPVLRWETVEVLRVFKRLWQVRLLPSGKTALLTLRRWWGHPSETIRLRRAAKFEVGLQEVHSPADPIGPDSRGLVRSWHAESLRTR